MAGKTCCCSVRNGTQIIAILSIIWTIFFMTAGLYTMKSLSEADPRNAVDMITIITDDKAYKEAAAEFFRAIQPYLVRAFAVFGGTFSLIELILCGLLLNGVQRSQASRCRPWLKYHSSCLIPAAVLSLLASLFLIVFIDVGWGILFMIAMSILISSEAYSISVVRRYIRELRLRRGTTPLGPVSFTTYPSHYVAYSSSVRSAPPHPATGLTLMNAHVANAV